MSGKDQFVPAEPPPAGDRHAFAAASHAACKARRELIDRLAPDPGRPRIARLGLALSGGGIRSATISLGALQAIASHGRLLDFDYVSTVSGGGYAGTFLRSLYLPTALRAAGPSATETDSETNADADIRAQAGFAHHTLTARSNSTVITEHGPPENQQRFRNPLWWLRQSGRYLAPAGTSDYLYAASYLTRNWLAMTYVFLLPILLLSLLYHGTLWSILDPASGIGQWLGEKLFFDIERSAGKPLTYLLSPLLMATAGLAFLSLATGLGYWLTEWLRRVNGFTQSSSGWRDSRLHFLLALIVLTGSALAAALAARCWLVPADGGGIGSALVTFGVALTLLSVLVSLILLLSLCWMSGPGFIGELRRRFTATSTFVNHVILLLLAAAVIDSLALLVMTAGRQWWGDAGWKGLFSLLLLPASAWLINRLSRASIGGNRLFGWVAQRLPLMTLIAGLLLFGLLAVVADALVISLLGIAGPDAAFHTPSLANLLFWLGATLMLTMVTGFSTGFINLSSLHNFYAARLIRAYLGGSNRARLQLGPDGLPQQPITRTHRADDIDSATYFTAASLAPLHLVNVTLNETRNRDGNLLVERDRKGVPLVFAPEGVLLDPAREQYFLHSWDRLHAHGVEPLTTGQLCAISGAAASTGMGEKTSIGTSLTLGFANLRLGYWWQVKNLLRQPPEFCEQPRRWLWMHGTAPLRTYFYLSNELTSRYSRDYGRLNLSDGGHFENSGAYELLRRRVQTILVLDNGADPEYRFDDLENLVRKARIDLGLSVNVAEPADIEELLGRDALAIFLNGRVGDWRARAAGRRSGQEPGHRRHHPGQQAEDAAFALLLNVYDASRTVISRMVWVKPRIKAGIPQDIIGYGLSNPGFPQQSTGDQFYDERQWESYRGLGYCLLDALFARTPAGADILRKLSKA